MIVTLERSSAAYTTISKKLNELELDLKPSINHDGTIESYQDNDYHLIVDWNKYEMEILEK